MSNKKEEDIEKQLAAALREFTLALGSAPSEYPGTEGTEAARQMREAYELGKAQTTTQPHHNGTDIRQALRAATKRENAEVRFDMKFTQRDIERQVAKIFKAEAQAEQAKVELTNIARERDILVAKIEGDTETAARLRAEQRKEEKAAAYYKAGMSASEAKKEAEQYAILEEAARNKVKKHEMQATGWLRTSLANVGGGGVSMRVYESKGLKIAEKTEQHTQKIHEAATAILQEVKRVSGSTAAVLS